MVPGRDDVDEDAVVAAVAERGVDLVKAVLTVVAAVPGLFVVAVSAQPTARTQERAATMPASWQQRSTDSLAPESDTPISVGAWLPAILG